MIKKYYNLGWKDSVGNFQEDAQNFVYQMIENSLPGWKVKNWQPFTLGKNNGALYDGFTYNSDGSLTGRCTLLYGWFTFFSKDGDDGYKVGFPTSNGNMWVASNFKGPAAQNVISHSRMLVSALSNSDGGAGVDECGVIFVGWKINCEFESEVPAAAGQQLIFSKATKESGVYSSLEPLDAGNNLSALSDYHSKDDTSITLKEGETSINFSVEFDFPTDSEVPADFWTDSSIQEKLSGLVGYAEGILTILDISRISDGRIRYTCNYLFTADPPMAGTCDFYIYTDLDVRSLAINNEITNVRVYSDLSASPVADEVFSIDNTNYNCSFDSFYLIAATKPGGGDCKLQVVIATASEAGKILKVEVGAFITYEEIVASAGTIEVNPYGVGNSIVTNIISYPNEPV